MLEGAAIVRERNDQESRVRLIALSLASWHDHLPVPGSRVRGESGAGEPTTVSGRQSTKRRDELLLRLEREREDGLRGRPDDANVVSMDAYRRSHQGAFWQTLSETMTVLSVEDGYGHRLLLHVFVRPMDTRGALARCHALATVAGGNVGEGPVETPRYRLVKALVWLDRHLPAGLVFPTTVVEQVAGWEQWLAAIRTRKTDEGRTIRSGADKASLRERDRYIRELTEMAGWTQQRVATHLGLNQSTIQRVLARR